MSEYNVDFMEVIGTAAGAQGASMFLAGGVGNVPTPLVVGAGATAGCMASGMLSKEREPSWAACAGAGATTGAVLYFAGPQLSGMVGPEYLPLMVGGVGSLLSQTVVKKAMSMLNSDKSKTPSIK